MIVGFGDQCTLPQRPRASGLLLGSAVRGAARRHQRVSRPSFEHARYLMEEGEWTSAVALSANFQAFMVADPGKEMAIETDQRKRIKRPRKYEAKPSRA